MLTFMPWGNLAVGFALAAPGQDPILTDRPDFTESSRVVAQGETQVESGITATWQDRESRSLTFPELLVRHGLGNRAELRLGLPVYTVTEGAQGFGDTYAGAKFELGQAAGTQFAVIPAVFVPSGDRDFRGASVSPEVKLVWSRDLPQDRSLSGMLYVASVEEGGRRRTPIQHTLSWGTPLAAEWGALVEHVLDVQRHERPQHLLHFGVTHQPHASAQFDVHAGLGLTTGAPRLFVGAGYSVRFR